MTMISPKGRGAEPQTTAPLQIAVIGAGVIGLTHVRILQALAQCEVAAIADPMPAAAAFAAGQGIAYFDDYRQMLEVVHPDAAIIATPNHLHAPVAIACAERGVHILVEKPIADTLEAAWTMVAAAEKAGISLLVGHYRRHNPLIQKAREIVQGGGIGKLAAVNCLCLFQKPDAYFDIAWRRQPGGGPVLINLIHHIDDLRFICGEMVSVQASAANAVRGFAVEDTAAVSVRFAGGALATLTISDAVVTPWSWEITAGENPFFPRQPENCYYFAGTEGGLAVPRLELWRYRGEKGWGEPLSRTLLEIRPADPLVRQIEHFCRVVRGDEKPLVTGDDGVRTLAATLAIKEAAATGVSIPLESSGIFD